MPLLWVQRPHCGVRGLLGLKQRNQRPGLQVLKHVVVWQLTQPHPLQRRIQHRLATVATPVALHPEALLTSILL
ncbi:hypothetical protein D3C75_1129070 [compost metagenome]